MDRETLQTEVENKEKDDYISDEGLEFLTTLPITVRKSKGVNDPDRNSNNTLVSVSLSGENTMNDDELREQVREKLTDGQRDIQKMNITNSNDELLEEILIISADYGFTAVSQF